MTVKNFSTFLLLTASIITLVGCQTATTKPAIISSSHENIRTMQAETPDSDGDGVFDDIDECPETPTNIVADDKGCPISVTADVGRYYGGSLPFPINSSQPNAEALDTLKGFGNIDDACVIRLSGHISKYEDTKRNKTLARDRVEFVKNYIILKYKVNPKQITTAPYGNDRSITSHSDSYEDSKLDQRVDVEMQYNEDCRMPNDLNNAG